MSEHFKDLIVVQYFPIARRIGRFAYTRKDCKHFNEEFREQVHASDLEHQSIILYIDNSDWKTSYSMREIEDICIQEVSGR